jgi:hypothetical protein
MRLKESVVFHNKYENYEDIVKDSDELFSYDDNNSYETNLYDEKEWDNYYHTLADEIVEE